MGITREYRGDAPAVSKVVTIPKPHGYQFGAITIQINNKKISYPSWDAQALVDAWNLSGYPETQKVVATVGPNESTAYGSTPGGILLTSLVPGEDFFVDVYIDGATVTNEVQSILFNPVPSGGTFTLTFSGQTTGAITYVANNDAAVIANIKAALEALSNIAPGDVVVTESVPGSHYNVQFIGAYLNVDVPLMTANGANLTGGNVTTTAVTSQTGVVPTNEVQVLSISSGPTGGNFTLTYAGQTTANIAYNANAAAVQSALVALSNIGVGDVVCSGGDLPGTPVTITFGTALAAQDVALITGSGAGLTGGSGNIDAVTTVANGATPGTQHYNTFHYHTNPPSPRTVRLSLYQADATVVNVDVSSSDSAATVKAALVGKTVGYLVDPILGLYRNYTILTGDLDVSGSLTDIAGMVFTFKGAWSDRTYPMKPQASLSGFIHQDIIVIGEPSASSYTIEGVSGGSGGTTGVIEHQQYEVIDASIDGHYTLTVYDPSAVSHNTGYINYSETDPAVIRDAINLALGAEYVYVTIASNGGSGYLFDIYWYNYTAACVNITQLTANEAGVDIVESVKGSPGLPEIQTVSFITPDIVMFPIHGGTFTLSYDGQTTTDIAYDATPDTIRLALEALSNIAPGDIAVAGSVLTGLTFTWKTSLGNVTQITANPTNVTNATLSVVDYIQGGLEFFFEETVRNAGPECFDDANNYRPSGLPSDGDTINYEYGQSACRWGLQQRDTFTVDATLERLTLSTKRPLFQNGQALQVYSSNTLPAGLSAATPYYVINADNRGRFQLSTTLGGTAVNITSVGTGTHTINLVLAALNKPARYSLDIGLPEQNSAGFIEYRPRYLAADLPALILGQGEGSDSQLTRFDLGIHQSAITIYGTGPAGEPGVPSCAILNQNASTDLSAYGGTVGLASSLDESAIVHDISLFDTDLVSIGGTTCHNITGDKGSSIKGKFTISGTLLLDR